MSIETQATLYLVLGINSLIGIATFVLFVIKTFRRKPPLETQFADADENRREHEVLHQRIGQLRDSFVTREMFNSAEHAHELDRQDIKEKLDELLQRTAHLVGYGPAGGKN